MARVEIKLSFQQGKGWKKSIGKHQGKNGKPQYKMWYLGRHKSKAQKLAEYITLEWTQLKRTGAKTWTHEALQRIADYKKTIHASSTPRTAGSADFSDPHGQTESAILTFYQAIDYYCDHFVPEQSFTEQWQRDLIQRTKSLKDALDDLTLRSIGHEQLLRIVNYYKHRPPNKNRKNTPISVQYASTLVKTAKRLFEWMDDTDRWELPKRFDRIFKVRKREFRLTKRDRLDIADLPLNYVPPFMRVSTL